jgi:hypothetical protein
MGMPFWLFQYNYFVGGLRVCRVTHLDLAHMTGDCMHIPMFFEKIPPFFQQIDH